MLPYAAQSQWPQEGRFLTVSAPTDSNFRQFLNDYSALDAKGKKAAFQRFRGDIIKADLDDPADAELALPQACWNDVCNAYGELSAPAAGNYPLPESGSQKTSQTKAPPPDTLERPSGDEYDAWKVSIAHPLQLLKEFDKIKLKPGDAKNQNPLTDEEWNGLVDSVWLLGQKYPYFRRFFEEIGQCHQAADAAGDLKVQTGKIRLREVLRKLTPSKTKGRKAADLDNYKGACAEIVDAFRTLVFDNPGDVRVSISIPKEYTKEDVADGCLYATNGEKLWQQDIDRTEERHVGQGMVKFYIEVKADVHTAVQKHQTDTAQLDRILFVVTNRAKKSPSKFQHRLPAVSIVKPDGWLELFTTGTAKNYVDRGFWLFIDGRMIAPEKLRAVNDDVRDQALPTAQSAAATQSQEKTLKDYFQKNKGVFPSPSTHPVLK